MNFWIFKNEKLSWKWTNFWIFQNENEKLSTKNERRKNHGKKSKHQKSHTKRIHPKRFYMLKILILNCSSRPRRRKAFKILLLRNANRKNSLLGLKKLVFLNNASLFWFWHVVRFVWRFGEHRAFNVVEFFLGPSPLFCGCLFGSSFFLLQP